MLNALKPFAKALAPAVLGAVVSVVNGIAAGSFNATSLKVLGAGLLSAVIAYLVPNRSTAKPAPVVTAASPSPAVVPVETPAPPVAPPPPAP